jgi:nitrite reductase/ring-hydroxylating ferredoxin subunit
MNETFIPLIEKLRLFNGFRQVFSANNKRLLLIHINEKTYLIENKCGHFGISLEDALLEQQQDIDIIICQEHGISFDLSTGKVVNRPWENCVPVEIFEPVIKDGMVGFYM